MQLPTGVVRRVDTDELAAAGGAWVSVATPLAGVEGGSVEMTEGDAPVGGNVIEVGILEALGFGVGVVENPLAVGVRNVGVVAVGDHFVFADDLDLVGLVLEEVEAFGVRRVEGPGEDVIGVAPDEVGRPTEGIEDVGGRAVGIHREEAGDEDFVAFAFPAVEENEAGAVWREQEVVEPVFGVFTEAVRASGVGNGGSLSHGEDELFFTGFEIDPPQAGVFGCEDVFVRIGDASVAVAGPRVVEAAEIRGNPPFSVRAESIDRAGKGALFSRFDVEKVADELAILPIVPHDGRFGAGDPLEHAALLPVPGA